MILTLLAAAMAMAAEPPRLRSGLEPLAYLVGACWRGTFAGGEVDEHCFEAVYDGQHVRDRHEVRGGEGVYRGETLYSADAGSAVTYTYWNSLGGVSRGTMRAQGERLDFGDEVYRAPDGRETRIATHWRRAGPDSYEAVSSAPGMPSLNRTIVYRRVPAEIAIAEERAPDGSLSMIHETVVDAPLADVWTAITTAEGWRSWAVPNAWRTDAEPDVLETSYSRDARPGDPSTIRHRVVATIPGRLLAFRTIKAPDRFPDFETFRATISAFELAPAGDGRTRVRTVIAGYPDNEAGRRLLAFFREGNRITLERMRRRFAEGPIDWSRER